MLMCFHHAAISTPDLEQFIDFYRRNFGCEVAWTFGWDAGIPEADALTGLENSAAKAAMLKLGESFLEVFEYRHRLPGAEISVLEKWYEHLRVARAIGVLPVFGDARQQRHRDGPILEALQIQCQTDAVGSRRSPVTV